jgi:hypothetical protein
MAATTRSRFQKLNKTLIVGTNQLGCHQEAQQETQVAEARRDGEDPETLGALSLDRLLVSAENPGYQNGGKIRWQDKEAIDR